MDTTERSSYIHREFRAFCASSCSLLSRVVVGAHERIHPCASVYYVFLSKSPCSTLKEKWWRFGP